MQKLIITRGLPASGKSSWAIPWAKEHPDSRVRVSRDDIRNMLGEYWVPKREGLITQIEDDAIWKAIVNGYDVVVDATHITRKSVKRWSHFKHQLLGKLGIEVELLVKDFTDVPYEDCLRRDAIRTEGKVGNAVISRMNENLQKARTEFVIADSMLYKDV